MEVLRDLHQRLAEHFTACGNAGGGSLFFLDHGLSSVEICSVQTAVRDGLRCKPLDSFDWQTSYLPLLVSAVEVGYGYDGNGTDFWPKLTESLGHDFTIDDRNRLSAWFSKASKKYGGVTPGNSQWELAFCHIAWPITHAVASRDIRRPFADCLRRFRRDVSNERLKDSTIVSDLALIPTPVGSRRFRTWLDRPAVVAGIVRDLLGGTPLDEAGLFSKPFRDRLIDDLRAEPEIRRAVRQVESGRKTKSKNLEDSSEPTQAAVLRFGEFFLQQSENGGFEFCGEMPELPKSVQRSLKPIRSRWKVRPWGHPGATPIPPDCLRSTRGHFLVSFSYVARTDAESPFFTGVNDLSVDDDAKSWLESVRFPTAEMLAFSPMSPGDDSSHRISSRAPNCGKIWLLARRGVIPSRRSEEDTSHCVHVGDVDGGEIYEFEADNTELRQWLSWPPANVANEKIGQSFAWLRPSPVSGDLKNQPVFTTDDELGVSVIGDIPIELELRRGQKTLATASVSAIATLAIESKGSYELVVRREGQDVEIFAFSIIDEKGDGFIEPDPETPWHAIVSHIDAGETELSRNDLFNHRLHLDVIGDRRIENLSIKLALSPGDASATIRLDRIPTRLAANHPVWRELIQQLPSSVLKSSCDLSLTAEIEGLSRDTWLLETQLQTLWWEYDRDGIPFAVSDEGPFQVRRYCVINGGTIDDPVKGDPFLSVALDADGNEFDFDTSICVLGDSRLHRQLLSPKRFLRQMDDIGDNLGLRSITQRYLQLSSASSSSLTAEINRVGAAQTIRTWILNCLCGPNWIHKQREFIRIESANPIEVWWECVSRQKNILQPPSESERPLPESLPLIILEEFRQVLPDSWWDGSFSDVEADQAEPLDSIFQHLIDDDTVIVDADALSASLRQANQRLCGAHLADLLIPVVSGDELLAWNLSEMSITDCASELDGWIRRSLGRGRGRQSWSASELQMWLNLRLYPERLRRQSWEITLDKLLHDRSVARAGAFIAWRLEQNARLNSIQTIVEAA